MEFTTAGTVAPSSSTTSGIGIDLSDHGHGHKHSHGGGSDSGMLLKAGGGGGDMLMSHKERQQLAPRDPASTPLPIKRAEELLHWTQPVINMMDGDGRAGKRPKEAVSIP